MNAEEACGGCPADIRAWWRKLKPGGWVSGHDILAKYRVPKAVLDAFGSTDEVRWGAYPILGRGRVKKRNRL